MKSTNKGHFGDKHLTPFIDKLVKTGECGTVIGLPNSGVSRIVQHSTNSLGFTDYFGTLDLQLLPHRKVELIANLQSTLRSLMSQGVTLVKVNNLKIYRKRGLRQLFALNSVRNELGRRVNFLFHLTFTPELDNPDIHRHAYSQLLFQNTVYLPYALEDEYSHLINQLESRFSTVLTSAQKSQVFTLSGGCPFLAKQLVKNIADGHQLEFSDSEASMWSSQVLADFRPSLLHKVKLALLSISEHGALHQLGFINEAGIIRSQILRQHITTFPLTGSISLDDDHLRWQDQNIDTELAPHEIEIVKALLTSTTVSRSQVAHICYGDLTDTNYSDSSLDKVMSRLRIRLASLGLPQNIILTVKKSGYKINHAYTA